LGQSNIDTTQVYVESSEPLAQFSQSASENRKYPSSFILDANLSSDIDQENGHDELSYDRFILYLCNIGNNFQMVWFHWMDLNVLLVFHCSGVCFTIATGSDRSFSNPNFTNIETTEQNNKIVKVSFDSV
jgi:hypothetical protein